MILIIDLCDTRDSLSNLEFVQPIKRVVESAGEKVELAHFSELNEELIKKSKKVILCGTALKDNEYVNHVAEFGWLKEYKMPVLGICAGMQMIGLVFGAKLIQEKEIGMTQIITKDPIFNDSMISAYELHGNNVTLPDDFKVIAENEKGVQAIKKDNIYGIVFHPEVRNRQLILNFLKI